MRNFIFAGVIIFVNLSFISFGSVDKSAIYEVLSGGSEAELNAELEKIYAEKRTSLTNAYEGTLLMKKAGFEKGAGNKLKTFKKGAKLLEAEISAKPDNIEFRFLRMIIQENAPKILKYNKNLKEDKAVVVKGYAMLDRDLKKIVREYAGKSGVIKMDDLK